ncbi:DUF2909 domain-containing protein [Exilibacterium tricleocarpae]|uniref:DUF2909 domain-containing protein n=1 Tax=Exilibacterium tricleocarpae TaxID=2591008 RepID=A0A545T0G4_9GAMM|nr:DUF2909 domain-containing protein [Exilibacterium tricleocarpae]TQV70713.1 DUF2909 domain-containing protein [Exilibacterium tricleocarpae]
MWLKIIIVVLFLAILASLSSALVFLLKDMGSQSRRTLYALGIRITLAALLMLSIFYGIYTGQLGSQAPWDRGPATNSAPDTTEPDAVNQEYK